jgi:hypothetical protein
MVYRKLVPTKHTDNAKEEEPTPGIWVFGLFRGQNTHQLTRLSVQRQGQRGAPSLPSALLLIYENAS